MKWFLIAQNTYREIMRDRILYGLVVFAILLIGLSLALGQLSFSEQGRIAVNFGLVGMQLSSVMLAIFAGSTLVSKEMEKQTILTILSKPLTRAQFLVGKYMGLFAVILVLVVGLSGVMFFMSQIVGFKMGWQFLAAAWGVLLEAMILLAMTLFFGVIVRPMLTVACTLGLFLIGHWINNLMFFTQKSESVSFQIFGKVVAKVVPNLESFNWRSLVVYQDEIPLNEIGLSSFYALCWISLILALTLLIFRRKDFV